MQLTRDLTGDDLARLWRNDYDPATGASVDYDPELDQWRGTLVSVRTDLDTLRPTSASYEVTSDLGTGDGAELVVAYDWTFDWGDCGAAVPLSEASVTVGTAGPVAPTAGVPPGFETVWPTICRRRPSTRSCSSTRAGRSRTGKTARCSRTAKASCDQPDGFYHEYTVETPGFDDRGARRIVVGADGVIFYTDDHYDSFQVVLR